MNFTHILWFGHTTIGWFYVTIDMLQEVIGCRVVAIVDVRSD